MHLSELSRETFVQYFGGLYEHSTWVIERAFNAGLTLYDDSPDALYAQLDRVVREASDEQRLELIRCYPDLAGKAASLGRISAVAAAEQSAAGLDRCSPEQVERFNELNRLYWAKFDMPFIMQPQGHTPDEILRIFSERFHNPRSAEKRLALEEVGKIARARLVDLLRQHHKAIAKPLATPVRRAGTSLSAFEWADANDGEAGIHPDTKNLHDTEYFPGFALGVPLGIQHVLALFVINATPAMLIISAGGSVMGNEGNSVYLLQMSILFAGIATLIQTIGMGPLGARLPIVVSSSLILVPVMVPIAAHYGMDALMGAIVVSGLFHGFLGLFIAPLRRLLPPMVPGLVLLLVGLALIRTGIVYSAGGVNVVEPSDYGSLRQWSPALTVIVITLIVKFYARGMLSLSALLIGLLAGYALAFNLDMVSLDAVAQAGWFAMPDPLRFGFQLNAMAITSMCLMVFVVVIATVGDISGVTHAGAQRPPSNREISGGTMADGLSSALSGVFGALPHSPSSPNVGLIAMTDLMSRHVVALGALLLICCGLIPKVGAVFQSMPLPVMGGAVIVLSGMVCATGVQMLSRLVWNRRNVMILAIALSVGLGLQIEPDALQHLPSTLNALLTTGLLPATLIAIVLDIMSPRGGVNEHSLTAES